MLASVWNIIHRLVIGLSKTGEFCLFRQYLGAQEGITVMHVVTYLFLKYHALLCTSICSKYPLLLKDHIQNVLKHCKNETVSQFTLS